MTGTPPFRAVLCHLGHTSACFGAEEHPCPRCGRFLVIQQRLQCGAVDTRPLLECTTCSLACPDCPSDVRVTEGKRVYARVIHDATCPWHARYQRREVPARIPCGVTVTHRGPYKHAQTA